MRAPNSIKEVVEAAIGPFPPRPRWRQVLDTLIADLRSIAFTCIASAAVVALYFGYQWGYGDGVKHRALTAADVVQRLEAMAREKERKP